MILSNRLLNWYELTKSPAFGGAFLFSNEKGDYFLMKRFVVTLPLSEISKR